MNILFITSTRLGDAVLSTGLLGHLENTHPDARFTIACGFLPAPLFRAMPALERVIVLEKRRWAGHWLRLWRACVSIPWDLVVDLRNSAVSRLIRARRRFVLPALTPGMHRTDQIARTLGLTEAPPLRLWFGDADRRLAEELVPPGPAVLAMAPVAAWSGKTWRIERFDALTAALTGPGGFLDGARVALLGTEAERAKARPLLDAIPSDRRIDLMGRLDPLEAAACLARCQFFVGNDSGPMHLAAAVGIPTLGLFGPSRPDEYAPRGRHVAVAQTTVPYEELVSGPDGFDPKAETRMDSLGLEAVLDAARRLWAQVEADR